MTLTGSISGVGPEDTREARKVTAINKTMYTRIYNIKLEVRGQRIQGRPGRLQQSTGQYTHASKQKLEVKEVKLRGQRLQHTKKERLKT